MSGKQYTGNNNSEKYETEKNVSVMILNLIRYQVSYNQRFASQ